MLPCRNTVKIGRLLPKAKGRRQKFLSTSCLQSDCFPRRYRMSFSFSNMPLLSEDNNSVLQRLCECLNVMYIVIYIYVMIKWMLQRCLRRHQTLYTKFMASKGRIKLLSWGMGRSPRTVTWGWRPRATNSQGSSPYWGTTDWLFPKNPWNTVSV